MSYDLLVFGQERLSGDELVSLVADAGLEVEQADSTDAESLTVVRGARRRYSFTLGAGAQLEPEDVPEEVTAAVLGPRWLYEILVEGSAASEIPHAVRFARRLGAACSGAVLDQQTGEVWARGKLRAVERVERGTTDVVELRWYVHGTASQSVAEAWLDVVGRHLPEALPRRFGPVEPLAMKLDVDGPSAFVDAVASEAGALLFFQSSAPCIAGHLTGAGAGARTRGQSLTVHRGPMSDPRWREALRRVFVGFAEASGAFFASAEVQRGVLWNGRSLGYDGSAERTTYLAGRGEWAGLLPYPAWWTWFGPEYAPLVTGHLPAAQCSAAGGGLFHAKADEPADRDQLLGQRGPAQDSAPQRGLQRFRRRHRPSGDEPGEPWLPRELLATIDASDPRVYNPPLLPAPVMPPGLRSL